MNIEERTKTVIKILKKTYPDAKTALSHKSPLELLIATILSAQCTDVRVNMVTRDLFRKYRSVSDYAGAALTEFENDIHSTGFYRNKAKNIINAMKTIESTFKGKIPNTMEGLTGLPGVGRKTANVVLGNAFGIVSGIAVDTHVSRLSRRLGLTINTDPEKIEIDLMKIVPGEIWTVFSHLLISHGRNTCQAKKPGCPKCVLLKLCTYKNKSGF